MRYGQRNERSLPPAYSLKVRFNANNEVAPALPVEAQFAAAEGVRRVQMIAAKAIPAV